MTEPLGPSRAWLAPVLLLAACTTQPPAPVHTREAGEREARSQAAAAFAPIAVPPLGDSARKPGPIPVQPLNVSTRCAFKDEGGTEGRMVLRVEEADVKGFNVQVAILNRGICNFDLKDFRQTGKLPIAVLNANDGRCAVRVWQQYERVTVAFADCESHCTGDAYSYLWPILADTRSGECS